MAGTTNCGKNTIKNSSALGLSRLFKVAATNTAASDVSRDPSPMPTVRGCNSLKAIHNR
ncbi:hypothetical protein D3C72_2022980 [compost metagenome]